MQKKKSQKAVPKPRTRKRGRKRGLKRVTWSEVDAQVKKYRTRDWYSQVKKQLSEFHRFSFAARKNFTPAQKAAITIQAKKLAYIFKLRKKGIDKKGRPLTISIVKVTRGEIKDFESRFNKTNRGLIVFNKGEKFKIISKKKKRKAILKRAAKLRKDASAKIRAEIKKRTAPGSYMDEKLANFLMEQQAAMDEREINREHLKAAFGDLSDRRIIERQSGINYGIFIPLLAGETIQDLIDWVFLYLKPDQINVAMGRGISQTPYDLRAWTRYSQALTDIENKIRAYQESKGQTVENPIKGLLAVWRTKKIK